MRIELDRDFDEPADRWKNSYTVRLTSEGAPLPAKDVEVWYAVRDTPGYDSYNKDALEIRMKMGGRLLLARTAPDGAARVSIPEMDSVTDVHLSYQLVVLFNRDGRYPELKSAQSLQFNFYAFSREDPPLAPG